MAYYALCIAGGAAGGGTAGAAATAQRAAIPTTILAAPAHGREQRDGSPSVRATALSTRDRLVGLAYTAQNLKLALTIVAIVLIERHQILLLQRNYRPAFSIPYVRAVVKFS